MNKTTHKSPTTEGRTVIEDGKEYYIIGKTRIKITEHFQPDGKTIDELVTALIENKMKESTGKGP